VTKPKPKVTYYVVGERGVTVPDATLVIPANTVLEISDDDEVWSDSLEMLLESGQITEQPSMEGTTDVPPGQDPPVVDVKLDNAKDDD
jgi:hypothetical protein